jgi:hypothetical protein
MGSKTDLSTYRFYKMMQIIEISLNITFFSINWNKWHSCPHIPRRTIDKVVYVTVLVTGKLFININSPNGLLNLDHEKMSILYFFLIVILFFINMLSVHINGVLCDIPHIHTKGPDQI